MRGRDKRVPYGMGATALKRRTVWYNTVQYSVVRYNTARYDLARYSMARGKQHEMDNNGWHDKTGLELVQLRSFKLRLSSQPGTRVKDPPWTTV